MTSNFYVACDLFGFEIDKTDGSGTCDTSFVDDSFGTARGRGWIVFDWSSSADVGDDQLAVGDKYVKGSDANVNCLSHFVGREVNDCDGVLFRKADVSDFFVIAQFDSAGKRIGG